MKRINFIYLILFSINSLFGGTFSVYEANYPGVKDYNVNIDEATLVVHPRGNFVEMNLYMTVSYNFDSWFFKNYNELEFLWQFSLPEEAIMHEFWLWSGDSIMSAQVLDKWTAELLFNDVSSPVRNPGLLTQSQPNRDGLVNYDLKLFPMKRNEKKRFKIQYLLPARPTAESIRVWLPTTQIIPEKGPGIDSLKIIYYYDSNPAEPGIVGTKVISKKQSSAHSLWLLTIPLEYNQFVEMTLPSPIKNEFYFSTFEQNGEHFYHLATYPPEVPKSAQPRHILVLIDFNRFNTSGLNGELLLSSLKETIQKALSDADSINIFVAYDNIIRGADGWVGCTDASVDALFARVMKRTFPSYSSFQPLIIKAADFINSQADSAEVLMFSNTNEISLSTDDKDQLADEIIAMFKPGTKLHFIDLENRSSLRRNYDKGYYETQLQSFYAKMSYATAGNLYFLRYYSIRSLLNAFFYEKISHFESVEVQLRFQEGYAHSKHLLALNEGYYPLHFPIMEVGKFDGTFPIDVTILGKIRMTKVVRHFTISEADVTPGTSQIATSWYGDHIRSLLRYSYSPLTVNDIINLSIDQKILTPYSGFLIYNPDELHGFCLDCKDESDLTPVLENENAMDSTKFEFTAFPNPFNSDVSISLRLPQDADVSEMRLAIFNTLGQKVRQINLTKYNDSKRIVHWNGQNENGQMVTSGVYFAVLRGKQIKKTLKLVFIR